MIDPEYRKCVAHSESISGIREEIACLDNKKRTSNTMYGAHSLSGEGYSLVDFLAFLPYDSRVFTISPFRDMELFTKVDAVRREIGIFSNAENKRLSMHVYNPSLFFTLWNKN